MKTFMQLATPEQREQLAERVKSSVAYFYQIAGGHKNPGPKLCQRLVSAEPRLTLGELRPDIWGHEQSRAIANKNKQDKRTP